MLVTYILKLVGGGGLFNINLTALKWCSYSGIRDCHSRIMYLSPLTSSVPVAVTNNIKLANNYLILTLLDVGGRNSDFEWHKCAGKKAPKSRSTYLLRPTSPVALLVTNISEPVNGGGLLNLLSNNVYVLGKESTTPEVLIFLFQQVS